MDCLTLRSMERKGYLETEKKQIKINEYKEILNIVRKNIILDLGERDSPEFRGIIIQKWK